MRGTSEGKLQELMDRCYNSLYAFACVVEPHREWGECHRTLFEFWEQAEINDIDNTLTLLPRDHQKAQILTDNILTPTGWTTFGEVSKGSVVIGSDGRAQEVVELKPVHLQDVWEVELDDGRFITCNEEHLFTLECPSNWGTGNFRTKSLSYIREKYIADRYDKRNGNYYKEYRCFIHPANPIELPIAELGVDPYTLGAWLGDGDTATGVLTTADLDILDNLAYKNHRLECKPYAYRVEGLTHDLRLLGVIGRKHIPKEYLFSSRLQREALLQGLMDTDGFAHKVNKNLSYTTILPELRDGVCALVRSLGGKAKVSDAWTSYERGGNKFHSYCINIWLPEGITPFGIERKQCRVKPMRCKSAIVDIRYKGKELARCISVSNEDGLYLSNDYFVTHNSHALAVYCVWRIYKDPTITILYASATSGLAERQLLDIQNILESVYFRRISPEMIHKDKGKRAMWNTKEMSVDHPDRKLEGVRDPTVATCGLTTNTTGWHCRLLAKDDVVVPENAYTLDARKKVEAACSQWASVLTTGGNECAVGTRYHPKDHYATLKNMIEDIHDEETGEVIDSKAVYAVHERQVEVDGIFLWPRKARASDGKMFGFNWKELARKKAKYIDRLQYFAQYYNNPNDMENRNIERGNFQYYDRKHIEMSSGLWYYKSRRLNVYASMDFAYSLSKKADWTCIVVFGIDYEFNVYILDIVRFKTRQTKTYFSNFNDMLIKWEFSRLRAEVTAAQAVIVQSLKDKCIEEGVHCRIDEHRPNKGDGAKQERIDAALVPRYEDNKVHHFKGGLCTYLEEEMLLDNPPHDDISDTLAAGLSSEHVRKPRRPRQDDDRNKAATQQYHSRFGGAI